jgi:hypothetical protein
MQVHLQLTNSKFRTVPMFVTIDHILSGPGVGYVPYIQFNFLNCYESL